MANSEITWYSELKIWLPSFISFLGVCTTAVITSIMIRYQVKRKKEFEDQINTKENLIDSYRKWIEYCLLFLALLRTYSLLVSSRAHKPDKKDSYKKKIQDSLLDIHFSKHNILMIDKSDCNRKFILRFSKKMTDASKSKDLSQMLSNLTIWEEELERFCIDLEL